MFQQLFNEASGIRGAAYSLAAMITFQNEGVAAATLHRADPLSMYCTVFNIYGVPQKQYDAFLCFKELRKLGTAVQADCADEGVYVAAATDGADVVVAISSYFGAPGFRRLKIAGHYEDAVYTLTRRVCDAERSLESVQTQTGIPSELDTGFYCCSPSLTLFTFKMNRGE